jgi:hypothetical protein
VERGGEEAVIIDKDKFSAACKSLQDREWSEDMEHVRSTYPTGYADGVGDMVREVLRLAAEAGEP